jgi:hypothetical protein
VFTSASAAALGAFRATSGYDSWRSCHSLDIKSQGKLGKNLPQQQEMLSSSFTPTGQVPAQIVPVALPKQAVFRVQPPPELIKRLMTEILSGRQMRESHTAWRELAWNSNRSSSIQWPLWCPAGTQFRTDVHSVSSLQLRQRIVTYAHKTQCSSAHVATANVGCPWDHSCSTAPINTKPSCVCSPLHVKQYGTITTT